MTILLASALLGLASSAHCAVMCGPLMLVFRRHTGGPAGLALYHVARIATYAGLGAAAGTVGHSLAAGRLGSVLSVAAGLVLIVAAWRRLQGGPASGAGRFGRWIATLLARSRAALRSHPLGGSLAAGAVNAFVPCGLLYAALTASAVAPAPGWAAASMAAFGLATTPALAAIWWSAGAIERSRSGRLRLAAPAVLALTGVLLIGRGLLQHQHGAATPASATLPSGHRH